MRVSFELEDRYFPADVRAVVQRNIDVDDDAFAEAMSSIAKAALLEYIEMLYDRGMPTKADEVLQERLYQMVAHYYRDRLPIESELQAIFQITSSKSRSLLKNTRSRYRTQIDHQIRNSVRSVIEGARDNGEGKYHIVIQSANVLDEINEFIRREAPTLQKLVSARGYAGVYECPQDTLDLLRQEYIRA